jgi:hypothetical protein
MDTEYFWKNFGEILWEGNSMPAEGPPTPLNAFASHLQVQLRLLLMCKALYPYGITVT